MKQLLPATRRVKRTARLAGTLAALACAAGTLTPAVADPALTPASSVQPSGAIPAGVPVAPSAAIPVAQRVIVRKASRRLELVSRDGEVLRAYRVALGLNPQGAKERSGDFRTPEGRYTLTRRNPRSDFFLSILVSYPSPLDSANAKKNGWDSGGSIMIHGLPNTLKHDVTYYQTRDWTDGCIAVSNADMVEIWLMTNDNTPIEILP